MNKVLFIVFLLVAGVSQSMFAQLNLNVSSGVNVTNCEFKNSDIVSTNSKMFYFVGLSPNYQLTRRLHVQLDCQYSLKGYKWTNSITSATDFKYEYIDLIPEIEFYLFKNVALSLGMNYGIKIGEKFKEEDGAWKKVNNELVKSSDFGLTSGIKLQFRKVFAYVRYNHGLKGISYVNILDVEGNKPKELDQRNRNLQIGVGYRFGFQS